MLPKISLVLLVLVSGFIFGALGPLALAQDENKGGPKLKLAEPSFQAGIVKPGSTVSHDFTVENIGDKDLEILQVVSGCSSCGVAHFDQIITPGQKGRVTIAMTYDPAWVGQSIKQLIIMETNDPQAKYVNLSFIAEVESGK